MAKDSSFDVVSETDAQEVDNAYQQAARELRQRYDLKDSGATLEFSRGEGSLVVQAPSEFVCGQVIDVLNAKLARRGVDLRSVSWGDARPAAGSSVRREGRLVQGIETALAKRIAADVRGLGLKCKVSVEGDRLRVSSPSKDTLQEVIGFLRDSDYGLPLQYVNYR